MHVNISGDRLARVACGDGGAIRINAYGAFCDLKVVEHPD